MITRRIPPVERASIANPGHEAAMEVHRRPVVPLVCARDRQVIWNDMQAPGQVVAEGDLDGCSFLTHDNPAQVLVRLACEQIQRVVTAKRRRA